MTVTVMGIISDGGQHLPLARDLREALAIYARRTWPNNTAKNLAREWKIDVSTAANLLKGHASDATVTRIFRAGGWRVAASVIGAVIGEAYDDFVERELEEIALARRQVEETENRARARWAALQARRAVDAGGLRLVAQEDRAWPDEDRGEPGTVGSGPSRRLKR